MRSIAKAYRPTFAAAILLSSVAAAHAQFTIVSDLEAGDSGNYGEAGSNKWFGQGFVTPSGTPYILDSVALKLLREASFTGTYNVSLWDATGTDGRPGSQIALISANNSVASLSTTPADYTFDSLSNPTLSANTTYYVVLQPSATTASAGLNWSITSDINPIVSGPGQIGGWTRFPSLFASEAGQWQTVDPEYPFQLAVYGTPVPEPQYYALFAALALLGFAGLRRRQERAGAGA